MRAEAGRDEQEAAHGINQLEGYLLLHAQEHTARSEALAFADRLSWLTTAQREEVVHLYTDERIALARRELRAVAARCHELRAEYTERYETLRARTLRGAVAVVLLGVCLSLAAGAAAVAVLG